MNRLLLPAPATKQEPPTEDTAPDLDIWLFLVLVRTFWRSFTPFDCLHHISARSVPLRTETVASTARFTSGS